MFICLCAQLTDSQWWEALEECERDWQAASVKTGAGQGCGQCRTFLEHISGIYAHQAQIQESLEPAFELNQAGLPPTTD